jgi:ABC-2 type transport system permease protein
MNSSIARRAAIYAGFRRGWIETLQSLRGFRFIVYLIFPLIYTAVLYFMRDSSVPGTEFALGAMVLPSIVGMSIAFGGLVGPAGTIAMEREDGTLLRAKATPNGMLGYLVGKTVMFSMNSLIGLIALAIPGSLVADELVFDTRTWLLLSVVFVLGMAATIPIGAALGALVKTSSQSGFVFLASLLLIWPSGIFYPITAMPVWVQWVGQVFPYYWLGLGARSAMLPGEMVSAEIGESWRTLEMSLVLGIWVVAGFVLAPILLRRMARRQSGSIVTEARQRFISKGY